MKTETYIERKIWKDKTTPIRRKM